MTDFINDVRKPPKPYPYPVLITDLADTSPALLPGGKAWPRFERDKRGVWSIPNKQEVEDARRARRDWAAGKRGG